MEVCKLPPRRLLRKCTKEAFFQVDKFSRISFGAAREEEAIFYFFEPMKYENAFEGSSLQRYPDIKDYSRSCRCSFSIRFRSSIFPMRKCQNVKVRHSFRNHDWAAEGGLHPERSSSIDRGALLKFIGPSYPSHLGDYPPKAKSENREMSFSAPFLLLWKSIREAFCPNQKEVSSRQWPSLGMDKQRFKFIAFLSP